MIRNLPPNETAGFGRDTVSGCNRSPWPPASMNACVRAKSGALPIIRVSYGWAEFILRVENVRRTRWLKVQSTGQTLTDSFTVSCRLGDAPFLPQEGVCQTTSVVRLLHEHHGAR